MTASDLSIIENVVVELFKTGLAVYQSLQAAHAAAGSTAPTLAEIIAAAQQQAATLPTTLKADDAAADKTLDDKFPTGTP